jgi:hypothetical protein
MAAVSRLNQVWIAQRIKNVPKLKRQGRQKEEFEDIAVDTKKKERNSLSASELSFGVKKYFSLHFENVERHVESTDI